MSYQADLFEENVPITTHLLNVFKLNGEWYIRTIPSKALFKSTMVHEVVNRGDIFAVRASDSQLTIISGKSLVEHSTAEFNAL